MSTKLQVSKAVTKKNTAKGGPVQSPGNVQNGTKKKCTKAAPKPRSSSGDGPPGGEVRKSSRPRKAKVWFAEGADATEEGANPVKSARNNLDGDDVDNQKHEDEAEANGKSGAMGENEVDEAVDEAGGEPKEEEEDLAEDDAEEKAEEEEGDEAEEEEGDEAEEEEGDKAEEEEGDESENESEDESGGEPSDEEDEESEEGQGDEDEAEKGSEKGDAAEVVEGADAHKPQITRKDSFDEMLEEQGDCNEEAMEEEAVAEERALLLGKLKALDEIKEPVVNSKLARKGVKPLPRSEPSKIPAKPPRGKDAVTAAKGKEKVLAKESMLVSAKPKSTPTAAGAEASGVKAKAGAGASGVKAKAGGGAKPTTKQANTKTKDAFLPSLPSPSSHPIPAVTFIPSLPSPPTRPSVTFPPSLPSPIQSAAPKDSRAAPLVKVITEATKRYELVPVKKTPFVAASCDRRQEHGGLGRHREVRLYLNPNSPLLACPLSSQPETPLASPSRSREELSRRVATHLCFNIEASMIQFYPSAEEALDHGFSEFVSPQVLASLRVLFQHNDASTRGVFFEQLSSTRTSINGWMRKVALTALGRQANRCYLGRLPADLLAPLEFYTDEELIARYKDALLNSSHLIRPLPPISSVLFLPSHPSPSSHLIRPLPPISSVPFLPSHPSPSSHLFRPLRPISSVPFLPSLPSPSVRLLCLFAQAARPAPARVWSSRGAGVEQQGQQGDMCGAAGAARGFSGAEQHGQQGDRCRAAGAAGRQVRSSRGSRGTGAEQQGQQGDRCGAAGAAGGQVRSSRGGRGTGAEQQGQQGDRCGAA
ncbi:unnamed protein product [Closterium sp. Naga37s-1]|nr:unnamed protein product [Closterium sp. Naga37s-1]